MNSRAGILRNNLSGKLSYQSFCPSPLPPEPPLAVEGELLERLIEANKALSALEAASSRIPDIDLFVSMYVRKESLLSSQIEGTQCTLEDILDPNVTTNANLSVSEVVNYVRAAEYAIKRMEELPLCNRLIKETHSVLMEGVRGEKKSHGEFRYTQNWIGGMGSTIASARYVPPNVEDMEKAMSDLEAFINRDDGLDTLLKAALIHYQFETIHPFLDGNGRVGRLLIVLFLMERKVISSPVLYVSCFLKENRTEYYDRMMAVRRNGDYEQWCSFFMEALSVAAKDSLDTIDSIVSLQDRKIRLLDNLPSQRQENARKLLAYLGRNPIIEIKKTSEELSLSYNTMASLVDLFVEKGILALTGKRGKSRIYSYTEYLDILRKDT